MTDNQWIAGYGRPDLFCRTCGALGSHCRCVEEDFTDSVSDSFDPRYEGNYSNGFANGGAVSPDPPPPDVEELAMLAWAVAWTLTHPGEVQQFIEQAGAALSGALEAAQGKAPNGGQS